jgi:hypothetical protein
MFGGVHGRLRLRGARGAIVWGHRTAVEVGTWSIAKAEGVWWLTARPVRADPFASRQRALLFTAPRRGGFMAFPVLELFLGPSVIRARIGPPEH